jgi:hypothetical protein
MNRLRKTKVTMLFALLGLSFIVAADTVVVDDQIVDGSLCVGAECLDGEIFDFDTIKLKADDPRIRFMDTSNSATFPTNDWEMGITDNSGAGPVTFFINDLDAAAPVLQLEAGQSGGVALGANSTLEPNAISVGAVTSERRIMNVAAGTDDMDGVNVAQFNAFKTQTEAGLTSEKADLEAQITTLQDRIDAINTRIDDLVARVDNL